MPIPVVVASRNAGKVREFARLFGAHLSLLPLADGVDLPEETGSSFAENALLKAETVFGLLGERVAVMADDSGLEVQALGGRPGIRSARYAGPDATDDANVARLLAEMEGIRDRSARFVCALALVLPEGDRPSGPLRLFAVRGESPGSIEQHARGTGGFGYDPVFRPDGWGKTLAEATPEEKDGASHRGAAALSLLDALAEADMLR